jgi:hypothetical protein
MSGAAIGLVASVGKHLAVEFRGHVEGVKRRSEV